MRRHIGREEARLFWIGPVGKTMQLWESSALKSSITTAVHLDGRFYGFNDNFPIVIEVVAIDGLNVEVTVKVTRWGGARAARARVRIDRRPRETRQPPRVLIWEPVVYRPVE